LSAGEASECPKCAAPLAVAPAEAPPDCPADDCSGGKNPSGEHDLLVGGLWLVGGIAVTAVTYFIAEEQGGGRYIVAWGAMFFGGVQFLRGLLASGRKQAS
jgi:hypothetical protein